MKNFYHCNACAHVFADGEGKVLQTDHGVTDPFPVYESYIGCPECGGEDLDDWRPCDTDDCEAEAVEGYDHCLACAAQIERDEINGPQDDSPLDRSPQPSLTDQLTEARKLK